LLLPAQQQSELEFLPVEIFIAQIYEILFRKFQAVYNLADRIGIIQTTNQLPLTCIANKKTWQ
jgi:hypothetical protein